MSNSNLNQPQSPKDPFETNLNLLIKESRVKNPYAIYKENLQTLYANQENRIKDLEHYNKIIS